MPTELGPVTRLLEDELVRELRSRGIVIWLDREGDYTAYVDALGQRHARGEFFAPVVAFRGSFLEVLLALERVGSGLDKAPLLLHAPGFTEESIRATPFLELYEPGFRFRRALETLVREAAHGRVAPEAVEGFLAQPEVTLAAADTWLADNAAAPREGLAGLLEPLTPVTVLGQLLRRELPSHGANEEDVAALVGYLGRHTGLDEAWLAFFGQPRTIDGVGAAFFGWLLAVEYVHDLARAPHLEALKPLRALTPLLAGKCRELVEHLRSTYPEQYEVLADRTEAQLALELDRVAPEDLGKIDTFRREDAALLSAAIEALAAGAWSRAASFAGPRAGPKSSFWIERDQARRWAWSLVAEAASVGELTRTPERPLEGARTLDEALERYAKTAWKVDRAHRQFEQKRLDLLQPHLPHFADLHRVVLSVRQRYRIWADGLACDFTALCRARGFLPSPELRQRGLYERFVQPLTEGTEKTALFLVDAFRFEMARELEAALAGTGAVVTLDACLAELPTVTAVGMNALPPVARRDALAPVVRNGRFCGFQNGEFTVRSPEDRLRAIGIKLQGDRPLALTLEEALVADPKALKKRIGARRLVLVHSRELDDAGEANVGPATFGLTLRQLGDACRVLLAAGVRQLVLTTDHGFLLQDETVSERPYGETSGRDRRYVLASQPRAEAGCATVSLKELGYEGAEGFLIFSEDTKVFPQPSGPGPFVHGGNSLQERAIPVLKVIEKSGLAMQRSRYRIEAQPDADVLGFRRLRVRIRREGNEHLEFLEAGSVSVALGVQDRNDIVATIRDVGASAKLESGRVALRVNADWAEVFFSLTGPRDEKVRVLLQHPDRTDDVAECLVEGWFDVAGLLLTRSATDVPPKVWQDAFAEEGPKKIFEHLERHSSITEREITQLLGTPRAFRKFSLEFEAHAAKVPFKVRIESTPDGKRYVKDA